jgi:ABC-2 type transport system permease protein
MLRFTGAGPIFCGMNEQTSSPLSPKDIPANDGQCDHRVTLSPRPVQIGRVNWIGLWTLYMREVQRFAKVGMQTVIAPVITSMLFLMVFAVAVGERAQLAGDTDFIAFLVPGLAMMTVLQNAFANTSSSFVVSKVQGNIVDLLMPPIGPGELLVGMAAGGMTRGIAVGLVAALVLGVFGGLSMPAAPLTALAFLILGSLALSFAGILAGIWANKFDEMSAITNFLIQPLAFLSGTFYSVDRLPSPFDTIATLNPFFYAIDGFRYGLLGIADRPVVTGIICLVLLNGVLGWLCYVVLKSGYRLKS